MRFYCIRGNWWIFCRRLDRYNSVSYFIFWFYSDGLTCRTSCRWLGNIQHAVDPAAQSLFAVDKLGIIPALSLATVIGVGVLATPSYRQRIYSAKTVSSVRRSFIITGLLYLMFSFLPAIIGMAVWTMNTHLSNSGFAFLYATQLLPPFSRWRYCLPECRQICHPGALMRLQPFR